MNKNYHNQKTVALNVLIIIALLLTNYQEAFTQKNKKNNYSKNGVYVYKTTEFAMAIVVVDNEWRSVTEIRDYYGNAVDEEYSNGIIVDNVLYYYGVEIGTISKNSITTMYGNRYVFLEKLKK